MVKKISERELEWLKREKYEDSDKEVGSRVTRSNFACQFKKDLTRLEAGEPIDYIIGWKEFLGCKIDLSARPLIPREETEFWVGEAIKEVLRDRFSCNEMGSLKTEATCEVAFSSTKNDFSKLPRAKAKEVGSRVTRSNFAEPIKILDLFSGSGCIGLAVLKHLSNAKVTFGDLYPVNKRTIKTNIFSNIKGKFDVIFANPPYVPTKKSRVQKSVKDWEPKEALFAGPDGLDIIKKFLKQAKDHLNPGGKIYLEFGFGQKAKIEKLLKLFGYSKWQFNKDQFGKYRWLVIECSI